MPALMVRRRLPFLLFAEYELKVIGANCPIHLARPLISASARGIISMNCKVGVEIRNLK
jgi:hypothetical protein